MTRFNKKHVRAILGRIAEAKKGICKIETSDNPDGGGVSGEAQGDVGGEQQQDQASTSAPQADSEVKADANETAAGEANDVGDPQAGNTDQAQ